MLSQGALQAHVNRLDNGLASVVEAQHASTAATQGLGAQIQQLLGHFAHLTPSSPPGLGTQPAAPTLVPVGAAAAPPDPTDQAATAAAMDDGASTPSPVKAAGKGKTGGEVQSPY